MSLEAFKSSMARRFPKAFWQGAMAGFVTPFVALFLIVVISVAIDPPIREPSPIAAAQPASGASPPPRLMTEPTETPAEPTTKPAPTMKPTTNCEEVPAETLEKIASRLTAEGTATLRNGYAVKTSRGFTSYFVAADIQAPGLTGAKDVAIWSVNNIDPAEVGNPFSVDGMANEFSSWQDGRRSSFKFSHTEKAAQEAKKCAEIAGGKM